MSTKP
jgi:hypothetical protein